MLRLQRLTIDELINTPYQPLWPCFTEWPSFPGGRGCMPPPLPPLPSPPPQSSTPASRHSETSSTDGLHATERNGGGATAGVESCRGHMTTCSCKRIQHVSDGAPFKTANMPRTHKARLKSRQRKAVSVQLNASRFAGCLRSNNSYRIIAYGSVRPKQGRGGGSESWRACSAQVFYPLK